MKLLTITYSDLGIAWGPAVHYLELWNAVAEREPGLQIQGWCSSWTGKPPIVRPKFPLRTLRLPPVPRSRQLLADLRFGSRLVSGRRPSVLYVRSASFQVALTAAIQARRFPVLIVEMNGLALEDEKSAKSSRAVLWAKCWSERALLRQCDLAICVSNLIASTVAARAQCPTLVVKNGVARQFSDPIPGLGSAPDERPVLIYVGTFTSWDGHLFIPDLARQFPGVDFLIVGDGPARPAVQASSPANVSFLGWVPYADLPGYYRRASGAFVLYEFDRHRTVELSSLKTLEYVATGLPVFSTRVKGQDYIEDQGYGYLLSEGEEIQGAFHRFLAKLPEYRANLLRDRERIRYQSSWERAGVETIAAIKALCNGS